MVNIPEVQHISDSNITACGEKEWKVNCLLPEWLKTFCSMCESQVDITDMDTGKVSFYGHYKYGLLKLALMDITDMDTGKVSSYGHYQYGHCQS
jgi:hypothetical protein